MKKMMWMPLSLGEALQSPSLDGGRRSRESVEKRRGEMKWGLGFIKNILGVLHIRTRF